MLIPGIRDASTLSDLRAQVYPADLCRGLINTSAVKQTVLQWLREIDSDPRDHQQIGADPIFSIRLLVPIPYWKAITTVSMQQGWPAEALLQGVSVNTGWLEHHATRLVDVPDAHHKRTPNIAAFYSAPPSLRKSSLKELVASKLIATESMPDVLRDGSLVCGDGTVKGLKACIQNHDRAGLVSDEVTSCYETPWAESSRGVHFACKSKLLSYVNTERDSTITGQNATHDRLYAFMHYVMGQKPAVQHVLKLGALGFTKRFHQV